MPPLPLPEILLLGYGPDIEVAKVQHETARRDSINNTTSDTHDKWIDGLKALQTAWDCLSTKDYPIRNLLASLAVTVTELPEKGMLDSDAAILGMIADPIIFEQAILLSIKTKAESDDDEAMAGWIYLFESILTYLKRCDGRLSQQRNRNGDVDYKRDNTAREEMWTITAKHLLNVLHRLCASRHDNTLKIPFVQVQPSLFEQVLTTLVTMSLVPGVSELRLNPSKLASPHHGFPHIPLTPSSLGHLVLTSRNIHLLVTATYYVVANLGMVDSTVSFSEMNSSLKALLNGWTIEVATLLVQSSPAGPRTEDRISGHQAFAILPKFLSSLLQALALVPEGVHGIWFGNVIQIPDRISKAWKIEHTVDHACLLSADIRGLTVWCLKGVEEGPLEWRLLWDNVITLWVAHYPAKRVRISVQMSSWTAVYLVSIDTWTTLKRYLDRYQYLSDRIVVINKAEPLNKASDSAALLALRTEISHSKDYVEDVVRHAAVPVVS